MTVLVTVTVPPPPPEVARRAERLTNVVHSGLRVWVEQQAREEARSRHFSEGHLRQAIGRRFQGQLQDLNGAVADALVFLVVNAAAAVMEQELRKAMEEVRLAAQDRETLRERLAEHVETRRLLKPAPPERAHLRVVPPVSDEHLAEVDVRTEAASVRMQLMMDRRTKFIGTMFTLMKRVSDLPDSAVRHLS